METFYVCLLTLLGVFALMLWLVFHSQKARDEQEERLLSVRQGLNDIQARVARLEESAKKENSKAEQPAPAAKQENEPPKDGPLTGEGVASCVRMAGYQPERQEDDSIAFKRDDDTYVIDVDRLPRIFISKSYWASTKNWDPALLQQAAHKMSDDIIMVKADVSEPDAEGNYALRFFVAAIEQSYHGFKENLTNYIHIIEDGQHHLGDLYEQYEKEKKEAASLNGLANSSFNQNGKTPS